MFWPSCEFICDSAAVPLALLIQKANLDCARFYIPTYKNAHDSEKSFWCQNISSAKQEVAEVNIGILYNGRDHCSLVGALVVAKMNLINGVFFSKKSC